MPGTTAALRANRPAAFWTFFVAVLCAIAASSPFARGATTITVASGWGQPGVNPLADAWVEIIERFRQEHPEIRVEVEWGVNENKLLTMIAGGVAPHVAGLGAQYVVPYGYSGQLVDLAPVLEKRGVHPGLFIPPAYRQLGYNGAQYGVPWMTNITFALVRNTDVLEQAGFDASSPVLYVDEIDEIQRKTTLRNEDGVPTRLGIIPHFDPGGDQPANLLTSWGWAFGGRWWDPATSSFTSDHPANVEALEWMAEHYREYASDLGIVGAGPGGFCRGTLTLSFVHAFITPDVARLCEGNGVRWEIGPQPVMRGRGVENPLWVSGPALVVPNLPRSAEEAEAAYAFLEFATTSPEALKFMVTVGRALPGVVDPDIWDLVRRDEFLGPWAAMLPGVQYSRPVVPNQRFWVTELIAAVWRVFNNEMPAREALLFHRDQVTRNLATYEP